VRFHIQQDSDIPASTQLNNQICFAIAARHYPPGHRLPSTRQLAMQTGLHRNTISKVYRQLEVDGVVEAIAGSGIYVRDNLIKREFTKSLYSKDKISKAPDQEAKKVVDNLISLGFTLQETREILNNEIDWRIKCGSRIIVSTPREDIGASMLIAEVLSTTVNVPVEVVPMEEIEKVLSNSYNGTIVTSRYFLQPLEKVAKQHGVRAIAVDLSDFQKELKILKELNTGSCVGIVSISPGLLRAAEVIIHSMRGSELMLMTAISDNNSRLLSLLKASNHIVCDGPSLSVVENTLLKNRSQLMRLPQIICAKNYLSIETINHLKKEINLKVKLGIAYNPYLKKYYNISSERERFERKISTGLINSIWFQYGTDIKVLQNELTYLKKIVKDEKLNLFGSLFIPSKQFIARFKFRPWKEVYISEKCLFALDNFFKFTSDLVSFYKNNNVTPVIESDFLSSEKLDSVYSFLENER